MRFGILAPMPSELRPVAKAFDLHSGQCGALEGQVGTVGGADVVATTTGMGIENGAAAARRMLDGADVDHVVVVGIAGGIGPTVDIADIVIPEVVTGWPDRSPRPPAPLPTLVPKGEIVSSDVFVHPEEIMAAFIESGVLAVDMETVAVADVCIERGVPWSAVRSISDRGDDATMDASLLAMVNPDGTPNTRVVMRHFLRHPLQIPRMMAWGRDAARAANAAARAAAAACAAAS